MASAGADVNFHQGAVSLSSPHLETRLGQKRESNAVQLSVDCECSRLRAGLLLGKSWALVGRLVYCRAEDLRAPGKAWGEHLLTLDKGL